MNCRHIAPSPSRRPPTGLACAATAASASSGSATSCACRQFAKLCTICCETSSTIPRPYCATAPVSMRSVVTSTRVPSSSCESEDSIVACAAPRPRDSRALAESVALRAASSVSSRLTSVSNASEIGPSFTFSFAFQFESSTVSVSVAPGMHGITRGTSISRSHAFSGATGTSNELSIFSSSPPGRGSPSARAAPRSAGPRPRRRPPAGCARRSEARSVRGCA